MTHNHRSSLLPAVSRCAAAPTARGATTPYTITKARRILCPPSSGASIPCVTAAITTTPRPAPAIISFTGVAGVSVTSGGISTIAALGTDFGKLGTIIANNGRQVIDWYRTTRHGFLRMSERGVTRNMVETWVRTGKALQQAGDKILYITKQGAVVINKTGQVITAYTSKYFDANMQKIVERLYGK